MRAGQSAGTVAPVIARGWLDVPLRPSAGNHLRDGGATALETSHTVPRLRSWCRVTFEGCAVLAHHPFSAPGESQVHHHKDNIAIVGCAAAGAQSTSYCRGHGVVT